MKKIQTLKIKKKYKCNIKKQQILKRILKVRMIKDLRIKKI